VRSALAALAQGAAGEFGRQAWAALARLVRAASGQSSVALDAVQAAQASPSDTERLSDLAALLAGRAGHDPGFAAGLNLWLAEVQRHAGDGQGGIVNSVSGDVGGTLVQARDISGGIRIGDSPGQAG